MKEEILGKKILIITAHPDDESYLAGGTIYENYLAGGNNILICATFGEKGTAHLPHKISEEDLAKMRARELNQVCEFLQIQKFLPLGFPDGQVENFTNEIETKVLEAVKLFTPDIILSFGEDGITGHGDHLAVAAIAKSVAKLKQIPLYVFTLSPNLCKSGCDWLIKRRLTGVYVTGYKEHSPADVKIPIDSSIKHKLLGIYISQLDEGDPFRHYPPEAVEEFLNAEYFHRVNFE